MVERPDLVQDRNWTGSADYEVDKINLLPASSFYAMSEAKAQQTFCHEFAHFLLYHAGGAINYNMKDETYIHKNEEFVDLLGSLLQQALSTMEYEEQP